MDYPQDFPAESRAKVEAAIIRAGRQFDSDRAKARWKSEIEALFWNYVLTPFLVFAGESSRLGLWQMDQMDRKCREFLRLLTIDSYHQKGKAAGLGDMISNWDGSIVWEAPQEIEKTSQWRKYENMRLKFAVKGKPTTQSTGIIPGQFPGVRQPNLVGESTPEPNDVSANPYFPDIWSRPGHPTASLGPDENMRNAISKKRARIAEIERTLSRPLLTEYRGQSVHGGVDSRQRLEEERQHLLIAVPELERELKHLNQAGISTELNPPRNEDPQSNPLVADEFTHSEDYRSVAVRGQNFTLTSRQAQVIQILDENGFMFARTSWINVPFFLAGALKILYDLLLYKEFVSIPPVEERP